MNDTSAMAHPRTQGIWQVSLTIASNRLIAKGNECERRNVINSPGLAILPSLRSRRTCDARCRKRCGDTTRHFVFDGFGHLLQKAIAAVPHGKLDTPQKITGGAA